MTPKERYYKNKNAIRNLAQTWQSSQEQKSWLEVAQATNYFEKFAKRYGLTKEFKNEGILWKKIST